MGRFIGYTPCPKCRERGADRRGDNLATYTDGSSHCFACGHHIFPKHYVKPVKVTENDRSEVLPRDFTRDVPTAGWQWLLQYGLPYSYWKPYCGYSPAENRLILTYGNPVQFSVGRYLDEVRGDSSHGPLQRSNRSSDSLAPTSSWNQSGMDSGGKEESGLHPKRGDSGNDGKYIPRKWKQYGDRSGLVALLGETDSDPSKAVVLVEDYISGHKVAQVNPCITLFGTNISTKILQAITALKRPVTLWLDEDQYGVLPPKLNRLNAVLGAPVSFIRSRKDPKAYSVQEIKEILK